MKTFLTFIAVLAISIPSFSQGGGNLLYGSENRYNFKNNEQWQVQNSIQLDNAQIADPNTITFNVRGLMNKKADAQMAIFNMIQVGETAAEANQLLNERYQKFLVEISSFIHKEDVYLDMVSQVPIYEIEITKKLFSKTFNEVPKGFELHKNIHILYRNPQDLDKILQAAANFEIYDLIKIDYYVENGEESFRLLRDSLLNLIEEKMHSFNSLIGEDLDTVFKSVQENHAMTFPIDRYSKYTAAGNSSIEKVVGRGVTTMRRNTTMFYDKLSYHNFDVIIDPVVLEPVVQYTYQIKVQYHRKRPVEIKIQNHYKIINSNGDVKPLEVK